eukprot:9500688-Pyramimonas_sp.AAC.2
MPWGLGKVLRGGAASKSPKKVAEKKSSTSLDSPVRQIPRPGTAPNLSTARTTDLEDDTRAPELGQPSPLGRRQSVMATPTLENTLHQSDMVSPSQELSPEGDKSRSISMQEARATLPRVLSAPLGMPRKNSVCTLLSTNCSSDAIHRVSISRPSQQRVDRIVFARVRPHDVRTSRRAIRNRCLVCHLDRCMSTQASPWRLFDK